MRTERFMFRKKERQEERERQIREDRNRLSTLSEKELFIEILLQLKRVEYSIEDVERSIRIYCP